MNDKLQRLRVNFYNDYTLSTINLYEILVSVGFITTVIIFPSLFINEVLSIGVLLVVILTHSAPG